MVAVKQTYEYTRWFEGLRDAEARARVLVRVRRLSLGNPGDVRPVGEGVSERRIEHGSGYRVYYVSRGEELVVLLAGAEKRTRRTRSATLASRCGLRGIFETGESC